MNHFSRCFLALVFGAAVNAYAQDATTAPAPTTPTDNSAPAGTPVANAPTADTPTGAINDASATFQTFYDGLAGEGTWIQTQQYGYVWQPQVTDPNWAPYTDGYWAYTQQGWTWVSNEAWGWATYHYGRWANLENVGWVWVPGYVWAPAWVSWRDGGGYVGWAPLPPDSMVGTDYASNTPTTNPADMGDNNDAEADYHIGSDVDDYYDIGPGWYIFIPIGFFCDHHHHDHYCPHADNFWIADQTHNVTNVNVSHKAGAGRFDRVSVGGPSLAEVNAGSSTPIEKSTIGLATQPGGGTASGNTVSFYAPHIHASTTAAPASVGMSVVQSSINHGTDVTRPLAVNSSLMPTNPTAEQIAKARQAQISVPAGSKVVTDSSMIKPFEHPTFSSLRPIGATRTTSSFSGGAGSSTGGNVIAPTRMFSQTGGSSFNTPPSTQSTSNQQHTVTQGLGGNPYTRTPVPSTPSTSSGQNYSGESHEYHAAPSSGQSSPYSTYNSDGTQNSTTTSSPSVSGPTSSAPASGGTSTHH